jgi:hypothetical protein
VTRLRKLLLAALAVKLVVLGLAVASHLVVPFREDFYWTNFVYPFDEEPSLRTALKTWDAVHYLFLADHGYQPWHISNAYYPLLPLAMRLVRPLVLGDALVAGLLVSTAAFLGAVALLFLLVKETHGEDVAWRAGLCLVAFPTSFYAGLLYTESLFLLLAIGLFYFLRTRRTLPALLFAFALPLTRPTGLLVALPAVVATFQAEPGWRLTARKVLVPLAFVLGFAAYLGIMAASTGDPLAGFDAQRVFQASNSIGNLLHPIDWFTSNYVHVDLTVNGFKTSFLNRACFVLFVIALAVGARRLDPALLVYTLVVGVVPAMSGNMTSYIRYVAVVFPVYIALATWLRRPLALWAWLVPSFAAQAAAVVLHASNWWVA